jgi:hypothetical protein
MDFAVDLALLSPHASTRTVINISANGRDNVGDGPGGARDRALATRIVINGLVIGGKRGLADGLASMSRAVQARSCSRWRNRPPSLRPWSRGWCAT